MIIFKVLLLPNIERCKSFTFDGICISVKPTLLKDISPIDVTLSGIEISVKFTNEQKAWSPIDVTPSSITTF